MPSPERTATPVLEPAPRWVLGDRRAQDRDAERLLFCFAHAGGGPSFFRSWGAALAPEIAVRPVLLPGRESRLDESPFRHIEELVPPLCSALEPYLDRPYALFGHSMGAVVAYEVARRLSSPSGAGPSCLLVSGRGPGLTSRHRRICGLPDDEFLAEVWRLNGIPAQIREEPELIDMILPALRADYEVAENYQPLPGGVLRCPVIGYLSTSDPETGYVDITNWREVTTGAFSVRLFRGDHFYLKDGRPDVLDAVREDLRAGRRAVTGVRSPY